MKPYLAARWPALAGCTSSSVPDLGDRAFEISGPRTASIYIDKDDELLLVMVECASSDLAPTVRAHLLAIEAAERI